jgi:hypothetical protein
MWTSLKKIWKEAIKFSVSQVEILEKKYSRSYTDIVRYFDCGQQPTSPGKDCRIKGRNQIFCELGDTLSEAGSTWPTCTRSPNPIFKRQVTWEISLMSGKDIERSCKAFEFHNQLCFVSDHFPSAGALCLAIPIVGSQPHISVATDTTADLEVMDRCAIFFFAVETSGGLGRETRETM